MNYLPLPNKVYKYKNAESALETLREQVIFLPSISQFNDPFDCKIPIDFGVMADNEELQRQFSAKFLVDPDTPLDKRSEIVDRILANGRIKDVENLGKMEEARIRKMEEVFAVFCLSVVPNNLLMWAHYADSHKGICIGFNPTRLIEAINPTWVGPVRYSLEYPKLSVLDQPETMLEILLFNKSIDWFYEKEIRYVKNSTNGGCKIQIPVETIEEIHLGCLATRGTEKEVRRIRAEKYPFAKIIKYEKDKLAFRLRSKESLEM
jgi:hypothetical protein